MWVTGKTSASSLSSSPSAASSQPITAATYSGGGWPQSSRLRPETHQETELQSEVAVPLFVKSQTHQRNDIYISLHISDTNWHSLKSNHTIRPDSHTHTHTHTHTPSGGWTTQSFHSWWTPVIERRPFRCGRQRRAWGKELVKPLCRTRGGKVEASLRVQSHITEPSWDGS